MHSRFVTWLFALLLLAMQQEAQHHALVHFADQLQRPHEQALQLPTDDATCALCALCAGGTSALPTDGATLAAPTATFVARCAAEFSVAQSPPAFYLSRAPPPLLA